MSEIIPAWVQAVAGVATFFAACLAVWATFQAPKRAAELAENLRRGNDKADSEQRSKAYVLETLLRHRASILHPDAVNALNLIDIVFIDVIDVREVFQQFLNSAVEQSPFELKIERYNIIIERIVRHLGMNDRIKASDIQRSYHPVGHAKIAQLQTAEMDERWEKYFNPDGSAKKKRR